MPSSSSSAIIPADGSAQPTQHLPVPPRRSVWIPFPRRRKGSRRILIGGFPTIEKVAVVILVGVSLAALIGPWLSPYDYAVPAGPPFLPPLSPGHLLGTDNLGLDVMTRVLEGARASLFAAVVVTTISALFGLIIGTVAGFAGGWIDNVLMRLTDLFMAFPAAIVAMAITAGLGPSLESSMVGITIVWWPLYARLVRGEIRRTAVSPHVEAARLSGTRGTRLVVRHVVPRVVPTVVVTASLDIGSVIMMLSALAFIGLGSPAPAPELGLMASMGMQYILDAWWVAVVPGLMVGLLALLFNYAGDGLRIALHAKGA